MKIKKYNSLPLGGGAGEASPLVDRNPGTLSRGRLTPSHHTLMSMTQFA